MRPGPDPSALLRAMPPAAAGPAVRAVGGAMPLRSVPSPLPPPGNRATRVLAAGLALSAMGHGALALWLVQTPAPPPPDGPDVPAAQVSLLSGAQFAALTAPPPHRPEVIAPVMQPPPDEAAPMALPNDLAGTPPAPRPEPPALPMTDPAPDVAALVAAPPDPQVAVLLPELTAPRLAPAGIPVARPAAGPVAQDAPAAPAAPDRADAGPVAAEAAPALPKPAATPPAAAPKAARTPASLAGDGGQADTTRAESAGSADARDGWLSAIRARVERRKAYPAAAGGAEGRVTLQVTVDRAGRLTAVGVARSSGNPTLDAAALRAVRSAGRFPKAPGAMAEAAVTFNLPLRFSAGS